MRVWASVAGRGRLLPLGSVAHASLKTAVQGDPYGRGKDYVDIKFKVPSQAWVADQPYS